MAARIAITVGDPAGIGPEVIAKGLARYNLSGDAGVIVVGPWEVFLAEARRYAPGLDVARHGSVAEMRPGRVGVLDVGLGEGAIIVPGEPSRNTSRLAGQAVEMAADLALREEVDALVTGPLTKKSFAEIGSPHHGHTEYLAWRAGVEEVAMMFVAGNQRAVLVTTHLPLDAVPGALDARRIAACARLLHEALVRDFSIAGPRLGVAGVNPHAGEGGLLGDEEDRVIRPAVEACRAGGLDVGGPYPADTLFWRMAKGEFDGVVAMYHDQALIPIKLLGPGRAVNVTLGLPFVRTSVGHGTGFDIAGRGEADETGFVEALNLAVRMAAARARARR